MRLKCACVWHDERCLNDATQEDGLCDWCGTRRPEDMRTNPKAMHDPETGEFMALGGAGELHSNTNHTPDACWMLDSGRRVVRAPITPMSSEEPFVGSDGTVYDSAEERRFAEQRRIEDYERMKARESREQTQ